jgi:DNA-binding MurR/RpiR family transcriptional regulator
MPGVIVKIKALYHSLPKAEKSVADCILADPPAAPQKSVHDFASQSGVSVASVSRFARTLGFGDFRSFNLELARETTVPLTGLYQAITPDDTDKEIVRKVFVGTIKSLEDTLRVLTVPDLVKAAKAISSCRRLLFFGIGGSGVVATDAAVRFGYLDFQAEAHTDASLVLLQAMRAGKGDVVVGISHSGRSAITVRGLKISKQRGALTIGISNYLRSPLRDASALFFCTSFPESRVKVAALSSRTDQICLLDALRLLVARYADNLWDMEGVNTVTEEVLRTRPSTRGRS